MTEVLWSIALISTGIGGLWLAGNRRPRVRLVGWYIYALNEVLWFAYALATHASPLAIMAVVWLTIGVRNVLVTRKETQ